MWDDDDKEYINGYKTKSFEIDELMNYVVSFFNGARQGYDFTLTGDSASGYVITATLKPTTKKAKELANVND